MNEKEVIKKITLLKSIYPEQYMLKDIKKDIYLNVGIENKGSNRYLSVGIIFALLILSFSFVTSVFLPDQIHKIILYSKIALAPNQYEKARLALADITSKYKKNTSLEKNNLTTLSQELAFTNTEMSSLKLKGEKGKYTAVQCHELYQQYLTYLKEENTNIYTASLIKRQIFTYEEHAEQKLHMYPHL